MLRRSPYENVGSQGLDECFFQTPRSRPCRFISLLGYHLDYVPSLLRFAILRVENAAPVPVDLRTAT
jgi:hypothetical protein